MIKIFIGYDGKESSAYHVLAHSIVRRSSVPVSITPIRLSTLRDSYWRSPDEPASTEFTFARFLTPYLTGFSGWAIFMDSDMLCVSDIADLYAMRDPDYAVQVVQHDYTPKTDVKMLGDRQVKYEKKNWSSLMLMNCAACVRLTPDYVSSASGMDLHQFKWLESDNLIGSLPLSWNWLVGEYGPVEYPNILHYTLGGPWWHQYANSPHADLWRTELGSLLHETEEARIATTRLLQTAAEGELRAARSRASESG